MKKIFISYAWLAFMIMLAYSCNIKKAGDIEGPVIYNPTFSFPVGTYTLSYDNLFSNMDLPLADTAGADSLYLVWFEEHFYKDSIGQYDTTLLINFTFDFLSYDQETIKSILFRINYMSELPSESYLQVYFDEPSGLRMDSLFLDGPLLIEAADTNTQGFVQSAPMRQKDVFFDKTRLDILRITNRLEFHIGIKTRRNEIEYYKYLARYKLFIQMGIRVELETELQ